MFTVLYILSTGITFTVASFEGIDKFAIGSSLKIVRDGILSGFSISFLQEKDKTLKNKIVNNLSLIIVFSP